MVISRNATTYEIIDPKSVGVPESRLVLGKHSGRHALKKRCEELGFRLTQEELDLVYKEITALADNKKGLMDEEIVANLARRSAQQASRNTVRRLSNLNLNILVLPGDGIGTEVTGEAVRVLRVVAEKWKHQLDAARRAAGRHRDP